MLMQTEITRKLQSAFEPHQVDALLEVIGLSYNNLVKVSDFSELKAIVQDLLSRRRPWARRRKPWVSRRKGKTLEALGESQKGHGDYPGRKLQPDT